jgi:predicted Zn-dependent peptidase
MVKLRYQILRQPLGLSFTEEELEKEKNDILIAALMMMKCLVVACFAPLTIPPSV